MKKRRHKADVPLRLTLPSVHHSQLSLGNYWLLTTRGFCDSIENHPDTNNQLSDRDVCNKACNSWCDAQQTEQNLLMNCDFHIEVLSCR